MDLMVSQSNPDHEFLAALDHLDAALDDGLHKTYVLHQRLREIRQTYAQREQPLREIVEKDGHVYPPLMRTLNEFLDSLIQAGAEIRRAEAKALYAEQMSMSEIAQIFGISRQRVSQLLQSIHDQ